MPGNNYHYLHLYLYVSTNCPIPGYMFGRHVEPLVLSLDVELCDTELLDTG